MDGIKVKGRTDVSRRARWSGCTARARLWLVRVFLTGRLSERIALGQEHAPLTHSLAHSLAHSLTHSLTHSSTHPPIHPLTMPAAAAAAAASQHDYYYHHRSPPDRASPAATAQLGSRPRASRRLPGLFSPSAPAPPPPSSVSAHHSLSWWLNRSLHAAPSCVCTD
jgi:hypothetical protein